MSTRDEVGFIDELCDSFETRPLPDGGAEFSIIVPPRFVDLWLEKLNELSISSSELDAFLQPHDSREDEDLSD